MHGTINPTRTKTRERAARCRRTYTGETVLLRCRRRDIRGILATPVSNERNVRTQTNRTDRLGLLHLFLRDKMYVGLCL